MKSFEFHIQFHWNMFGMPIHNMTAFVEIMVWSRTVDKPLSAPIMNLFTDACMHYSASMGEKAMIHPLSSVKRAIFNFKFKQFYEMIQSPNNHCIFPCIRSTLTINCVIPCPQYIRCFPNIKTTIHILQRGGIVFNWGSFCQLNQYFFIFDLTTAE